MELTLMERSYCNKLLNDVMVAENLVWKDWCYGQKLVNEIVDVSQVTCNPPIDSRKSTFTLAHCEQYLSSKELGLDWFYFYKEEVMNELFDEIKPTLQCGNPFTLYQAAKNSKTAQAIEYPWFKPMLLEEISDFSTSKEFLEIVLNNALPISQVKKKVNKI